MTATPTPPPAATLIDRVRALAADGRLRNHVELVTLLDAPSADVAAAVAAEIEVLTERGHTRQEISTDLGLRVDTIRRHAREKGIAPQSRRGPRPKPSPLPASVLEALAQVDAAEGRAQELAALRELATAVREARDLAKTE